MDHIHPRLSIQLYKTKLKIEKISTKVSFYLRSIDIPTSVFVSEVHLSAILPSGQMHPKVESITIQIPTSPQYECSQTAIKRRARMKINRITQFEIA